MQRSAGLIISFKSDSKGSTETLLIELNIRIKQNGS